MDEDGCCPSDCSYVDDNDCNADDTSSIGTSVTLPTGLDGDHAFFDFASGKIHNNFETGHIIYNNYKEIIGNCFDSIYTELQEATNDDFPSDGWDGYVEAKKQESYWVKTFNDIEARKEMRLSYLKERVDDFLHKY
jgi:hypothetical protein